LSDQLSESDTSTEHHLPKEITMPAFTQEEILAGLAELVTEETGLPAADVQPDKSFVDDLDIDSLSMMTIVVNAQDKFNVEIPDEAVTELKTVSDAVAYITKAQSDSASVGQA
jgi:acyl carrier protein